MAVFDALVDDLAEGVPIVYVISDSTGTTGMNVVRAAASQFEDGAVEVRRLSKIRGVDDVRTFFDAEGDTGVPRAVFHTIVDYELRKDVRSELDRRGIPSIDLLGPAMNVISTLTNEEPIAVAGRRSSEDERYHTRVTGMNYFAEHDEGNNPEGLKEADAILFGVSRTSKTPLSLYLAFLGFKVANVTYVAGEEPPKELFEVDPRRVFGMVHSDTALTAMRQREISTDAAFNMLGSYAGPEGISDEQRQAKEIMEKIGCTVISVDGMAIEDLAFQVLEQIKTME